MSPETTSRSPARARHRSIARAFRAVASLAVATTIALASAPAAAQQRTFHLDRLEIPGGPQDGIAMFRPQTEQRATFYGQLALGYSLRPLRTSNITSDRAVLRQSRSSVIQDQFTVYGAAGVHLLDRLAVGVSFPITLVQTGGNPTYPPASITGPAGRRTTAVDTSGPSVSDLRLDLRGVVARSNDRRSALGLGVSVFAPTGNGSSTNFGGDGQTTGMLMVSGETAVKSVILVANTGLHFRPRNSINDPVNNSGLGIGNEWRWSLGAFLPLKDAKYRLGLSVLGQTGIESDTTILGDTVFTKRNTPLEWQAEGRMKFGPGDSWWAGLGLGTRILNGYGAPDLRTVALIGTTWSLADSDARSPEEKSKRRAKWRSEGGRDSDGDGIPDDLDACPSEPEDHLGSEPNDGCPAPADRDGDGIPDEMDKCPDQPEDKDGIDDGDGCPEDDADNDGIVDTVDACPKEPGGKNTDAKKNGCPQFIKVDGSVVRIMQQVHFATGSTRILPDSFPMLQEIANLMKANRGIAKLAIDGHTDNKGGADMNKKLSQGRSDSVKTWLSQHGVEPARLEARGYGLEKPIEDNATAEGRAKNRRVEFNILDEKQQ